MKRKLVALALALVGVGPGWSSAGPGGLVPPFEDAFEVSRCWDHVAATCHKVHEVRRDGTIHVDVATVADEPLGVGSGGADGWAVLTTSDVLTEEAELVEYEVRLLIEHAEAEATGPWSNYAGVMSRGGASALLSAGLEHPDCPCRFEGANEWLVAAAPAGPQWQLFPNPTPSVRIDEELVFTLRIVPDDEGLKVQPGRVRISLVLFTQESIGGGIAETPFGVIASPDAGRARIRLDASVVAIVRTV